jgi:uncharacterized membrane protein YecN with MAPEG domain
VPASLREEAPAWCLLVCFVGFPLARILHTLFDARSLMPHRTVAYALGFGITVGMALSSLWSLLF